MADILGHAISRLLNASNLATLAAKVKRERHRVQGGLRQPAGSPATGAARTSASPKADAVKADRVRTAKAVKTLLAACDGKEPTALVGAIAQAKLDTNSTSMGQSLKSAKAILECLRDDEMGLVLGGRADRRRPQDRRRPAAAGCAARGSRPTNTPWPVGWRAKLSEAEGRAIKLLTPPKQPSTPTRRRLGAAPAAAQARIGNRSAQASKARLTEKELIREPPRNCCSKLEENPRYRLTIQWTLEEGPQ